MLRQSIAVRNPYVDPLNLLQAELLHRLRQNEDPRTWSAHAPHHHQRRRLRYAQHWLNVRDLVMDLTAL